MKTESFSSGKDYGFVSGAGKRQKVETPSSIASTPSHPSTCSSSDVKSDHGSKVAEIMDHHNVSFSSTNTNCSAQPPHAKVKEEDIDAFQEVKDEDDENMSESRVTVSGLKKGVAMLKNSTAPFTLIRLVKQFTIKQYFRLRGREGKFIGVHTDLINGIVEIFELRTGTHESVANIMVAQLARQHEYICSRGSADIQINANTLMQPDQSLFVDSLDEQLSIPGSVDDKGNKLPKVVFEAAYTQPYENVCSRVERYFSVGGIDGIQAVILIFVKKHISIQNHFQMVALYYHRGDYDAANQPQPSQAISFGHYLAHKTKNAILQHGRVPENMLQGVGSGNNDQPCNAQNLPLYQLSIPGTALWHGYTEAQQIQMGYNGNPFLIDLYTVQRRIVRSVISL